MLVWNGEGGLDMIKKGNSVMGEEWAFNQEMWKVIMRV